MIFLASNSPRRKLLLTLAGWDFTAIPAHIDEQPLPAEDPGAYVLRLAESKAQAVGVNLATSFPASALIVAADTTVVVDGEILGKPGSALEAKEMLQRLRKRTHQVSTGLAVLSVSEQLLRSHLTVTDVHMRDYNDEELSAYINTGDPLDKAGAYAIQHSGFHPVEALDGCYANVVGLPLCQLNCLLAGFGRQPTNSVQLACEGESQAPCPVSQYFAQTKNDSGAH